MTQRQCLLNVLREAVTWVPSYDLQKVNTRFGWLGTSSDRAARLLAEEGLVDRQRRGKYTYYRFKTLRAFGEHTVNVQERRRKKFTEVQKSLIEKGQESLI